MKIVLDSSVAGFLLQRVPRADEREIHLHTRSLVDGKGHVILLPTPALGEILAGLPVELRAGAIERLERLELLTIVAYDIPCALIAAGLPPKQKGAAQRRPWQEVKIDTQIVAFAIRHKADAVCVMDGDHEGIVKRSGHNLRVGPPGLFLDQVPLLGGTAKRDP